MLNLHSLTAFCHHCKKRFHGRSAWFACFTWCLFAFSNSCIADLSLPKIIADHMVLQQQQPVPIWGSANKGDTITVRFAGQTKTAVAGADGTWQVMLDPLEASFEPRTVEVENATDPGQWIRLHNVLVGEVWFCGGQSNMEMACGVANGSVQPTSIGDPELAADLRGCGIPGIRLFRVEKKIAAPEVVTDGWQACEGEALARFSAIGYLFSQNLVENLHVPVGIIQSAWGGTRIEPWTPASAYAQSPVFATGFAENEGIIEGAKPGWRYEAMVQPLIPFALRGVLWYQGESNLIKCNDGAGLRYADKMKLLIDSWREAWQLPELPFYFVQIAPFLYSQRYQDELVHPVTALPEIWECQQRVLSTTPFTAMAPVTDLVWDLEDIHPLQKRAVAGRLAALAMHRVYPHAAQVAEPVFPEMESVTISETAIEVRFKHVGAGLQTRDGLAPDSFEIAGENAVFFPAQTRLKDSSTVQLHCKEVSSPLYVRFGWHETARPNLCGSNGWPAYLFRTDTLQSEVNTSSTAPLKSDTTPAIPEVFDLYLLMGQSNMAGRGELDAMHPPADPKIWVMDHLSRWKPAVDPLHGQTSRVIPGKGPGLSFAKTLRSAHPSGNPIALIPCAVGGTALERWEKDGDLYRQALLRAQRASQKGKIKGILWHQGESDSNSLERAASYQARLTRMILDLRSDLGIPNLPVILGETGHFLEAEEFPYAETIRQAIRDTAASLPYSAVVSSEGLHDKGDHLHFDAASAEMLGRRYAKAIIDLQTQTISSSLPADKTPGEITPKTEHPHAASGDDATQNTQVIAPQ